MFEADTSSPLKLLIWANQEPDSQHLQYQKLKIKSQ